MDLKKKKYIFMNEILKGQLDKLREDQGTEEVAEEFVEATTQEEIAEEAKEQEELQEQAAPTLEEKVQEVKETPTAKEPKKVELDIYDFIKNNKDTVLKVLDKDKDFSSVSHEQALRLKLEKENPEWDKTDIEAELEDKYGVGLEKIEIDEDTMDAEEIKEAKSYNKQVEAAQRSLKKDGKSALEYLSNENKDLELPKFEYTYDEEASQEVNTEDIITQYTEQLNQTAQKAKEEQWIPELQRAFTNVESVK